MTDAMLKQIHSTLSSHLRLIKKLTAGLKQLGKNLDQLCKRVDKIEMAVDLAEPVTQDDIDALSRQD